MTNILIADDHAIVRYGIALILKDLFPQATIKEAETFDKALKLFNNETFDLLLLDIHIPGGDDLKMIDAIKFRQPQIRILIFSGYDEQVFAIPYLQAGALGYLSKQAPEEEIRLALKTVSTNKIYLSNIIKEHLLNQMLHKKTTETNPLQQLSGREIEVMKLLIKGMSVIKIAETLSLRLSTVSTYKARIFEKLNVSNVIELVEKNKLYSTHYDLNDIHISTTAAAFDPLSGLGKTA